MPERPGSVRRLVRGDRRRFKQLDEQQNGSAEQMFGANEQVPHEGQSD